MLRAILRHGEAVRRCRKGAIAVVTALALPFLLGAAGLAVEFGNGLMTKVVNQRVADAAAYAGAQAYSATNSVASIQPAAARIAALNGVPASSVVASLGLSPRGTGARAIRATVTTSVPLVFSRILGSAASLSVPAGATVEMTRTGQGCLYALDALLPGISLSAGSLVTAVLCDISTNASIAAPCGSSLSGLNVSYNSTLPPQPCGTIRIGINGLSGLVKKVVSDPLVANAGVEGIQARGLLVSTVILPSSGNGAAGGSAMDFGTNTSSTKDQAKKLGCTATIDGTIWTLDGCPAAGVTLSSLKIASGHKVIFAPNGPPSAHYVIRNAFDTNSGSIVFGPGSYHFAGDFKASSAAVSSFGNSPVTIDGTLSTAGTGALTFGAGAITVREGIVHDSSGALTFGGGVISVGQVPIGAACEPLANFLPFLPLYHYYSICATGGALIVGGASDISLTSGIYLADGVHASLGAGIDNSYRLGRSTNGNGLKIAAHAGASFAGALAPASRFEVNGSIVFAGGAGSCLMLPAAAQHDIAGNLDTGGGVIFGAGIYTIGGYFAAGNTSREPGQCNGRAVSVEGTDVTFALTHGATSPLLGACMLQSFCIANGFSGASLKAPTAGSNANLLLVGPLTTVHLGALLDGVGSELDLSGTIYYPRGPVTMSGSSGPGSGGVSDCLMTVASRLSFTGGSIAAMPCNMGSASPVRLALVD